MKNRVLTFLMVIGMVGLLVGCSKLTKATLGTDNLKEENLKDEQVFKTDEGKDIVSFKVDVLDFDEEGQYKIVNDEIQKMLAEKNAYYDGDFKTICEDSIQYMPTDDIVFEAELKSELKYNSNGVVSIVFNNYQYAGGAHGSTTYYTLNVDTNLQKVLTFDDVFVKGCEPELKKLIIKGLEKLNKEYGGNLSYFDDYEDYLKEAFDSQYIYFTENGVTFIYNESLIAPYAAGPMFVEIPFKDLEEYMIYDHFKS